MERRRGPDVLFVGHEATRTGAPLMLLYLLRWLRANTDLDIALLLLDGGPLVADYAETADVQVLSDLRETAWSRSLSRLRLGQLASSIRSVVARSWCRRYAATPLVYCNSVRSVRALGLLPKGDRTIVSHVHELELAISVATPAAERRLLLERPDWYIAASELVKQNLVDNHGIAPERIARHYEFIEVEPFLDSVPTATEIDALRDELAIPPGAV